MVKNPSLSARWMKVQVIPIFLSGSFAVDFGDHLRSRIICGLGIIYGWGSFAVLYSCLVYVGSDVMLFIYGPKEFFFLPNFNLKRGIVGRYRFIIYQWTASHLTESFVV